VNLRPYQIRSVAQARAALAGDRARVCLVMPTGAGKTITASAIAEGEDPLWLVHTRALRDQAPGRVATIQSLLRGDRPKCSLLIADESHHFSGEAEAWKAVAQDYPRILGLTATPCRHDGAPLSEQFDKLIVGAQYSELLAGGWIVPCRVVRPIKMPIDESGLAREPIKAWERWAIPRNPTLDRPKQGFAFFGRVKLAEDFALQVPGRAGTITGNMDPDSRAAVMDQFRSGQITVLSSVNCLTEGVDVPSAEVCLLARGVSHEGSYLQAVGRVLRPSPGKTSALLIDLPGASFRFGMPTDDREYSLHGRPISSKSDAEAITQCPSCGCVYVRLGNAECPECGYQTPLKPIRVRIWDIPLAEVDTTNLSAEDAKKVDWRARMERDPGARREWFAKKLIASKSPMQAVVIFKKIFGRWPTQAEGWTWPNRR